MVTSIGVSASVIETIYSALKWVHDIVGVANPMTNPFVKTVVEGVKRENANPVVKKAPISKDALTATCNELLLHCLRFFFGLANLQVSLLKT